MTKRRLSRRPAFPQVIMAIVAIAAYIAARLLGADYAVAAAISSSAGFTPLAFVFAPLAVFMVFAAFITPFAAVAAFAAAAAAFAAARC